MSNARHLDGAAVCLNCIRLQRENEQLAGALQHATELGDLMFAQLQAKEDERWGDESEPGP